MRLEAIILYFLVLLVKNFAINFKLDEIITKICGKFQIYFSFSSPNISMHSLLGRGWEQTDKIVS